MRVLHLWKSDFAGGGGGAIAMNRLHIGLREAGIDSQILCENKTTESPHVSTIRPWRRTENLLRRLTSKVGLNDVHRISSFWIGRHEAFSRADVLHFHGTHSGFINYLALPTLTRDRPALFTLHDMWALTGHCAFSHDCDRWKFGCGNCPYPDTPPAIRRDSTRIEWKLKNWVYGRSELTIVSPSTWMTEQAQQSMLSRFPIYQIPHGVDTEIYKPLDKKLCRSRLGIKAGKRVLMISALRLDDQRKGADLLLKALKNFPELLSAETVLLILGKNGEAIAEAAGLAAFNLGFVSSDRDKAIAYSAADLFVSPSRSESFGLVLLESMACGTPTVSFKVGGMTDLVRQGCTGLSAEPEDAEDLCNAIVQLLEDESALQYMGQKCREIVLNEYTLELQVQRHIELYRRVLPGGVERTEVS